MELRKTDQQSKIRVMIASTLAISGAALTHFLSSETDLDVIATVSPETRSSAIDPQCDPDILLAEIDRNRRQILTVVDGLQKQFSAIRTVVLLRHPDADLLRMFLRAGVKGFVVKTANTSTLFDAMRAVHQGHRYLDPILSSVVMDVIETGAKAGRNASLTDREQQVLDLISRGSTYKEIANTLNVSVKTVETYRTRLGEKLQLRSRKAITEFATTHGLVN